MNKLFFILLMLAIFCAKAQETNTITGTVTDEKGGSLPGATVFLTNTRHSTATNNNGKFSIAGLEPGNYEVVIKMLGYQSYVSKVTAGKEFVPVNAQLKEDNILLGTVTVTGTGPNHDKYLKLFTKYFIGESTNSRLCKILNPQVLNIHYDKNTSVLTATAGKLLVVENSGLGYRLNYLLNGFSYDAKSQVMFYSGYAYFEELKGTESLQKKWEKNRKIAFLGSERHFFQSVFNHTAEAEGFSIYPLSDLAARQGSISIPPVPADQLFTRVSNNAITLKPAYNQRLIDDTTALFVLYRGAKASYDFLSSGMYVRPPVKMPAGGQLSKTEPLADKILIDKNGGLTPENSFLVSGYWLWEKIAEMMPLDYKLGEQPEQPSTGQVAATDNKTNALDDIVKQYTKHADYHAVEKIYLQLNKPWYNRADTIWFKAYTVMADNKLTDISEVAYAELINNKDSVISRLKLKLANGMASGDFTLPITQTPGTYHIRAYTNWMRNQDQQYFYDRPVNIGGIAPTIITLTTSQTTTTLTTFPTKTDIQFFPEGGTLVNGIRSRVAFKAVNPDGRAAAVKGSITAADGVVIAQIQSGHAGMGVFEITPEEGKTYKAMVSSNGVSQTVELPVAATEGFSLAITDTSPDSLVVTVAANTQLLAKQKGHNFYLVTQAGGKVLFTYTGTLEKPSFNFYINKKQLPTGIARFTLLTAEGEPVNERIAFIQQADNLTLNVNAAKTNYASNEKVDLAINASTHTGQPVSGNFSAAVINESLVPADETTEPTIFSQLLLSSELHGTIADPGYYFTHTDRKTVADLDLLMLTQGFRKLEWKQLLDTINKPTFIAESGLAISGVVKTLAGVPVARGKVSLFVPKQHIITDTLTDSNGRFNFAGLSIIDSSPVMLKATKGANNTEVNILLDKPYPNVKATPLNSAIVNELPGAVTTAMQNTYQVQEQEYPLTGPRAKARELKEVVIKARKDKKPDLSTSANLHGGGQANQVIMGKDLNECVKLSECLASKLTAVSVYPDGEIVYLGRGIKTFYYAKHKDPDDPYAPTPNSPPMAVFVDGAEINSTMLNYINAADVYSIEVLTSVSYTSIYGQDGFGGVLVITTKRGSYMGDEPKNIKRTPGLINYLFNGYYKTRAFYTPKYAITNSSSNSAIYWKPDLVINKDGKTSLDFTNAGRGNYRVVIEGIDNDGNIGRYVYRYKVE
jgi:hypothetical protein